MRHSHQWRDKFSVWYQHNKHKFSNLIYTGQSYILLISAMITGVQMGDMSKLG
jgi:hypothetical protein